MTDLRATNNDGSCACTVCRSIMTKLSEHGITGSDARTAVAAFQSALDRGARVLSDFNSDSIRVAAVLGYPAA